MMNIELIIKKLGKNNQDATAWHELGFLLKNQNKLPEAEYTLFQALQLEPNNIHFWNTLASLYIRSNQAIDSKFISKRVLEIDNKNEVALVNLGGAHILLDEIEDAEKVLEAAHAYYPSNSLMLSNLSTAYIRNGKFALARQALEQSVNLNPNDHTVRFNYALLLLQLKEFKLGWEMMESRWESQSFKILGQTKPVLPKSQWGGSSLKDKTLLVYCEQGLGDTIQFCRYVKSPILNSAKKIIFVVQDALVSLLVKQFGDKVDVVSNKSNIREEIDFHIPLLSLPRLLEIELNSISGKPYLNIDLNNKPNWLQIEKTRSLKIGLCWSGGAHFKENRRRNINPLMISALVNQFPGFDWYSLQKDGGKLPVVSSSISGGSVHDLMDNVSSMLDTARLIAELDLVISVDTSIAHLTASIGKPVWMLNRFGSEWRWFTNESHSVWYDTMKIYNQTKQHCWFDVFHQIRQDLDKLRK